jgi:hypothetical protein
MLQLREKKVVAAAFNVFKFVFENRGIPESF